MPGLTKLVQRFQGIENIVPKKWRLPFRYRGQQLVGGLEPEMRLLEQLTPSGSVALDIGANHGVYAYALSHLAHSVNCFEPLTECCSYIRNYRATNISVHNVALSDQVGELELYVPIIGGRAIYTRASLDHPNGPYESYRVDVRTLDSYEFTGVGFIKIDVEGIEAAVLEGATHTLSSCHPALLVEIDRNRHDRDSFLAVHSMLHTFGYETHVYEGGKLVACSDAWIASRQHINFIFI